MTQTTQTPTLEQALNKTDLGHVIYENRKMFFLVLLAILAGTLSFLFWKQLQKSSSLEHSVKVFEFQEGPWKETKEGTKTAAELQTAFNALDEKVKLFPTMIPLVLSMGKFLYEKGHYAEAESMLSQVSNKNLHPTAAFFIGTQRAIVLEKLGKVDEAVSVLEPLAQTKDGFMTVKVSLELGRLYLKQGHKGKAQTQFEYILNTFPNDELAKMAKLYLQELAVK